jgi:hypothetical protein
MPEIKLGDVSATRVVEYHGDAGTSPEEPATGRTRLAVLGWAADNGALVMPAHVGGTGGVELTRNGTKFAIKQWAPFDRI